MDLKSFLSENKIPFKENILLSELTKMSLDGLLPLIATPNNIDQLECLYRYLLLESYSYEIIGGLTNTYLCSGFYRDIVIQTKGVKDIIFENKRVIVGCGYSLTKISRELSNKGVTGFEGFIGIPGTIGAAAINNSGAFGYELSQVVIEVRGIDKSGNSCVFNNEQMNYSPRNSVLKDGCSILLTSVVINTSLKGDIPTIAETVNKFSLIRKHDIDGERKSLGSVIASHSIQRLWKHHRLAFFARRCLFYLFRKKTIQCKIEFGLLGGLHLAKYCDNIGRFCWSDDTKESDFFEYLSFIKSKSHNEIQLEIEIKR